jgi:hypothetical protein
MKTVPKVLLLVFGLVQLLFVLYISLPAIPKEIKNEEIGTMYTLGELSFNLSSNQYTESEEIKEMLKERGGDSNELVVLIDETNDDTITIFKVVSEDSKLLIEESFYVFSNPFQNRFVTKEIQEKIPNTAESIDDTQKIKKMQKTIYKGQNKTALLTSITNLDNSVGYSADIKIGDSYYSIIPHKLEGYDSQLALRNIMEFLRTSSLNN